MARPAKAVGLQSKNLTNAEKEAREFLEAAVKGAPADIAPPGHLTEAQATIFREIVDGLRDSGILGGLDVYILTACAIAVDRLADIESAINIRPGLLSDSAFMGSKDKYTKDLYRCCNELCLSPQARAKLGSLAVQAAKRTEDPLLSAMSLSDDD